jgi:hypothetical protein
MKIYTVIYRTGGELACEWHRSLISGSFEHCQNKAEEVQRMGYKTLIQDRNALAVMGLPVGWDADSVDWENDTVEVSKDRTRHVSFMLGA